MRFILIVKACTASETGWVPDDILLEIVKFHDSMLRAGVVRAVEGLHPSSQGARVQYSGDERTIIEGPFSPTKELITGFWVIQVNSREEAIDWARRVPFVGGEVEVRQVAFQLLPVS